jgi:signal transduction histidine kinase
VSNLVDNAIKFTQQGSVLMEMEAAGDAVNVRVTYTGTGVSEKFRDRLFEEFTQAEGKGGREGRRGFGMGLAICRFLARQLGGDVRLAATGPGGSCFEATVRDMAMAAAEAEAVRGTARHDVAVQ